MARKTASRIAKRREAEAAASKDGSSPKKKRKSARKKSTTTRRKSKAAERKRLVWGVFSGSLKEEARFPYDQRKEAEEKLEQLRSRGKKLYFIQPIKEVIPPAAPQEEEAAAAE
ncbi:MAG: hypothetical protein AB7I48_06125 [Planctomycetaceae bacterium]